MVVVPALGLGWGLGVDPRAHSSWEEAPECRLPGLRVDRWSLTWVGSWHDYLFYFHEIIAKRF